MTKEQSQNMEAPPQKRNRMWLAETDSQKRIPPKTGMLSDTVDQKFARTDSSPKAQAVRERWPNMTKSPDQNMNDQSQTRNRMRLAETDQQSNR
jgi:hypothetical protein